MGDRIKVIEITIEEMNISIKENVKVQKLPGTKYLTNQGHCEKIKPKNNKI